MDMLKECENCKYWDGCECCGVGRCDSDMSEYEFTRSWFCCIYWKEKIKED